MATIAAPVRPRAHVKLGPFRNEPSTDFSKSENFRRMRAALDMVRRHLGREYDLIIAGRRLKTAEKIQSLSPARPSQIVGVHQRAGKEHVEPAIQAALNAFETWSRTPLHD